MPDMIEGGERGLVAKSVANGQLRRIEAIVAARHEATPLDEVIVLDARSQRACRVADQMRGKIDCLHGDVALDLARDRIVGLFDTIAGIGGAAHE